MISLISIWFKGLSKTKKVFTVIVVLLLLALSFQSARLSRSEYLRLKAIEKEYNDAKEAAEASEARELEIVEENKSYTLKSSSKNQKINEKLRQDEKIIDSDSVSNNDLTDFISKHEN